MQHTNTIMIPLCMGNLLQAKSVRDEEGHSSSISSLLHRFGNEFGKEITLRVEMRITKKSSEGGFMKKTHDVLVKFFLFSFVVLYMFSGQAKTADAGFLDDLASSIKNGINSGLGQKNPPEASTNAQNASADELLEPESDILGFKLSMTQKQAKDYAKTKFKGRPFLMVPVKVASSDYAKDSVLGFFLEVKSRHTDDPVLMRQGVEMVRVAFNPNNSNDIYAVSRFVNFGENSRVTTETLVNSLTAKYGKPVNVRKDFGNTIYTCLGRKPVLE